MASFQKRGKTWQYTISRMVDGKSKPIRKGGFRTKPEAKIAAAEMEAKLYKGLSPHLNLEPFDEYFESWIDIYKKDVGSNTLARYKNTLKTIREYWGSKPIQKITKRSYQDFLNKYAQKHAKESTRKVNTHIRACVKDAIDEGVLHKDFTRGAVVTGDVSAKRPEEKHLDYGDSQLLLKELFNRLDRSVTYYLLLLALTSGMRFAEMIGLTRKDFDFINNTISINKTWGYMESMHEGFGDTKNEQSVRTISIDERTMKAFQDLFDKTPENIHKLVFYSPISKYKVVSNAAANKLLQKVLKDLKLKSITLHGLRHTHASILLYQKVSIYYVSERLGHGNPEITHNTYAHIVKELREQDEKKTSEIFNQMYA